MEIEVSSTRDLLGLRRNSGAGILRAVPMVLDRLQEASMWVFVAPVLCFFLEVLVVIARKPSMFVK